MGVVQLNVRIDGDLKAAGDAVLERSGVSAVQVVRSVWQYMADHQRVPAFTQQGAGVYTGGGTDAQGLAQHGAGLAQRLAREAGIRAEFESMSYEQLRAAAYEEMLLEEVEARAQGDA